LPQKLVALLDEATSPKKIRVKSTGFQELKKYFYSFIVATPVWPSVGVKPNTSKVGDLESSGTPECLGFDSKAQNTSH